MERKDKGSPDADGRWCNISSDIICLSFCTDNMASHYHSNNR